MKRSTVDTIKDDIDGVLGIVGHRTARVLKDRLGRVQDLIEYLQVHHLDQLEQDLEECQREDRRRRLEARRTKIINARGGK